MKLDPAQWKILSELLDQALDLTEPARTVWLERLGGSDAGLKSLLREMLAQRANARTGDFIDTLPAFEDLADEDSDATRGALVGPYRLLRELGRGGMGKVWLAERADGLLRRRVALKLPLLALSRGTLAERFARERELLAPLSHPHIARLYDAGFAADGQPYLALEYVDGLPLTVYADAQRLDIGAHLALFDQVLEAVAYAHANLVLHRDLKPSNILVTPQREVKLLDFGVAKLMADGQADETALTRRAGHAMTLAYAAPEQIAGLTLSTAADTYALGVLLYELLTGERPYRLKRGSQAELEEAISVADPVAPSRARISESAASARGTTLQRLRRRLGGDLDTIVLKARKKHPADRYASATALADDLKRYRDDLPVLAQPESAWSRTRRIVRRNALVVTSGATVASALLLATIVSLVMLQRADRAASQAIEEAAVANAVQAFMTDLFRANGFDEAAVERTRSMTAEQLLDRGAAKIDVALKDAPKIKVALLQLFGEMYKELGRYEPSLALRERSVAATRAVYGEESREFALALLERAWVAHHAQSDYRPLEDMERARQILARVAPSSEDYAEALYMKADYFYYTDPPAAVTAAEESVQIMERLGAKDKRSAFAKGILAKAYMLKGNLEGATKYLRATIAEDEALFGPRYANVTESRMQLARLYRMQLRLPEAEAELRRAFSVAEDRELGGSGAAFYQHIDLATVLFARGKLDAAQRELALAEEGALGTRAQGEFDNLAQMRAFGAALSVLQGEVQESVTTLESVLVIPGGSSNRSLLPTYAVYEQLARAYLMRGELERAAAAAQRAQTLRREHGSPAFRAVTVAAIAAEIQAACGDAEGAQAAFDQARSNYPPNPAMRLFNVGADMSAARIAAARGDWKQVDAILARWLQELGPGVELPQSVRGEALMLAGEAATRLTPDRARALLVEAEATLHVSDVPDSPRLVQVRRDLSSSQG